MFFFYQYWTTDGKSNFTLQNYDVQNNDVQLMFFKENKFTLLIYSYIHVHHIFIDRYLLFLFFIERNKKKKHEVFLYMIISRLICMRQTHFPRKSLNCIFHVWFHQKNGKENIQSYTYKKENHKKKKHFAQNF